MATAPSSSSPRKIVLVGAGFLASYIARALIADPRNRVLLVSRNPKPSEPPHTLRFDVSFAIASSSLASLN